jgi:predicted DsbA family dithiol-disulfide isomerase
MKVTIDTDPGCQFGFNAQRQELQLMWHYGHAATITRRMIGLVEESSTFEELGLTAELVGGTRERLARLYGMPMGLQPPTHAANTLDACRLYVGARTHAPERSLALLRSLCRRAHSDQTALDDRTTVLAAAAEVGVAARTVDVWLADDRIEAALHADMASARNPLPEALALPHRLAKFDGGQRYTSASAVFEHGDRRMVMAGFQPFSVYEVAVANAAPEVEPRDAPQSVEEVLAWAPDRLATAEVAAVRGVEISEARRELEEAGATFMRSGTDGYWTT